MFLLFLFHRSGWRPRGRRQRRGAGSPNVAFLADTDRAEDGGGYGSRRLGWDGDGRGEEEGYLSQKGGERALTGSYSPICCVVEYLVWWYTRWVVFLVVSIVFLRS